MCSNNINVPTSIVYKKSTDFLSSKSIHFTISNVTLVQQPSEEVDVILSLWHNDEKCFTGYETYYYTDGKKYYGKLILSFKNGIGVSACNYTYEVICRAQRRDTTHHQNLFTITERRITDMIIVDSINIGRLLFPITHFCFTIRRFKHHEIRDCLDDNADMSTEKLSYSLGSLLESGIYSDVVLRAGDQDFKVHKHVLAASSPVFKAMFSHDMSEQKEGVVEIVDIEPDVVAEMLLYIYTGRVKNIARMPTHLFRAAHKYDLQDLSNICKEFMVFGINCSSVVEILELVNVYQLISIKLQAEMFVSIHEQEMVQQLSYLEYLKRELNDMNFVDTLKLCARYSIADVKQTAFNFVKRNWQRLAKDDNFLELFRSHPDLMKEIYIYMSENSVDIDECNFKKRKHSLDYWRRSRIGNTCT